MGIVALPPRPEERAIQSEAVPFAPRLLDRPPSRTMTPNGSLREQHRRQPLASVDSGLVGRTPGLEELDELLARAVVVPFAVALHDFEQIVDRLLPAALAVQGDGEIEARLMVERIGRDLLLELRDRSHRLGLLG